MTEAVFAIVVAALATSDPAAGAPSQHSQAEALVRQGIELRRLGDDQAAVREFKKAYDLERSPRVAAQLGLAEQAIGRWAEAAVNVGEALHSPADPWVVKNRKTLDQTLALIKTHVGRVEVVGEPQAAENVNGRAAGRIPTAEPILVNAGEVDVEVKAPGYVRATRSLQLGGGQYQQLVIRLEQEPAVDTKRTSESGPRNDVSHPAEPQNATAAPTDPPVSPPGVQAVMPLSQRQPSTARLVVKWSALGLAGAGLGVGVAATVIHQSKANALNQAGCFDNGGTAVDGDGVPRPGCQGILNNAKAATIWQFVGFIGAGVFVAAWLILALTESSPSAGASQALAPTPSWTCAPSFSQPGAVCVARF